MSCDALHGGVIPFTIKSFASPRLSPLGLYLEIDCDEIPVVE